MVYDPRAIDSFLYTNIVDHVIKFCMQPGEQFITKHCDLDE